jgi:dienelactone hydrolase
MMALKISILLMLCGMMSGCHDIRGEEVEYTADNVVLKSYLAYDNNIKGKRPGILVVHEWWGQNEYVRKRARMLAELGYTALAVDMYGEGKQAEHPDDARKYASEIFENMDLGRKRFTAALEFLRQGETVNPERIAAIGYCFGGSVVLQMARSGVDIHGVVSFHGGLSTREPARPGAIKAKILVYHGADDEFVPPDQVAKFREEMLNAKADFQIISYAGAKHSFTNPDADLYAKKFTIPVGYNAEADRNSWADMERFFKAIFKK